MCENLNACHPQTVSFRHWAWYEWVTAAVFLILLIYSIIGIILISIVLYNDTLVLVDTSEESKYININQTDEKVDPKTLVHPTVETYVLDIFLVAHILLLITAVLVLIWLKCLRNMCVFLVIFVLLIICALLFLLIGALAVYLRESNSVENVVYKQVLNNVGTYKYVLRFWAFQDRHDCCGVRGYKDWEELGKHSIMPISPNSVPDSCCRDKIYRESCGQDILTFAENSENIKKIYTKGCLEHLDGGVKDDYIVLAIFAFVVAVILLGLIILLMYICHRLYLQLVPHGRRRRRSRNDRDRGGWNDETDGAQRDDVNANYNRIGMTGDTASNISRSRGAGGQQRMSRSRGRDREDDHESYIVPGTPAKSMISDDEQTFYAP